MTHEKKMTKCAKFKSKKSAFLNVRKFDGIFYFASAFKNKEENTRSDNSTRPLFKIFHAHYDSKTVARGKINEKLK